jgi:hypothetical protein
MAHLRELGLAAIVSVATAACANGSENLTGGGGGTTSSATTTSSSTGAGGGSTSTGTGGGITGCNQGPDTVLAVDRLFFGDTTWDDVPDTTNGWKLFGHDIDGTFSTATSTGLCQPSNGAPAAKIYSDGPNGLDNSFGQNVLPVFLQSIPSLSYQANAALVNGDFSILVRIGGLGSSPDQGPLVSKVYGGAYLDIPPVFDGTDCWPVTPESLSNPTDFESAKTTYPTSKVVMDVFDSVSFGDLDLTLKVLSYQGHATIHHARITMVLDPDHQGTQRGIISGVLDTEEFVSAIDNLMGNFDPTLCSGSQHDYINQQLRQASDIMKDGTQDPTQVCNGISIGLGFKAVRVKYGTIGDPLAAEPHPCTP